MPHFILDCSENILQLQTSEKLINHVFSAAESSGLFQRGDIKVRINSFVDYTVGGGDSNFIHVFGHIMEGRTIEQKAKLSRSIVVNLKQLFPDVQVISINIQDFEKATYCNRSMI